MEKSELSAVEGRALLEAFIRMVKRTGDRDMQILEIGDYRGWAQYAKENVLYGPSTVVLRLRVNGQICCRRLCITGAVAQNPCAREMVRYACRTGAEDFRLMYEGEPGDFSELAPDHPLLPAPGFDAEGLTRAFASAMLSDEEFKDI